MKIEFLLIFWTVLQVARAENEGLCMQPSVENGIVTPVSVSGNIFVANVTCHAEFERVGKEIIKCVNGIWSSNPPVCTRLGGCEVRDLPEVANSRRILVRPFRGSVVRYKCHRPFHLFGENTKYCTDIKTWSDSPVPICVRRGCDESKVHQIAYGSSKKLMKGAVYQFSCDDGAVLVGSPLIFCDGKKWNDTTPTCLIPPERLTIEGPEELTSDFDARFTCKASASNLPSKLTFKLTSHDSDLLDEFVSQNLVEMEEPKEKWIEEGGWASTRSVILKRDLLQRATQLGEQIAFECQVADPYHERRILISATKFVMLQNPSTPLPIEVKLKVSGPSEVRFNEPAAFRCSANRKDVEVTISLDSNWVQTAFGKAEFMLKPGEIQHGLRQFVLNCFALDDNNDKITISHYVDVLYPPGVPEITGKSLVRPGNEQKLTCVTTAGNPPAKLSWFRGSAMMESHYSLEGDVVKAEVIFTPGPEDNGSKLRCEAINEAVTKPIYNTITIELLPESTTTISTTTTTQITTEFYENQDEYYDYNDEDYNYVYPDEVLPTDDPSFLHPELTNSAIFLGKITEELPKRAEEMDNFVHKTDKNSLELDEEKWKKNTIKGVHENEVYPKDAPYRASRAGVENRISFMAMGLILLQLRLF